MNESDLIAKLIYEEKNYEEALNLVNASHSDDILYQKYKAEILFRMGKFEDAAKLYESLNDFYNCAYCYFLMNKIDLAIELFQKAEDSPAKNWSLFFAKIFIMTEEDP